MSEAQQDDQKGLAAKVRKWVEEQGYSLEMRVAKRFQENGFAVSQFDHFVDRESQSIRPVDVVASFAKDFGSSRVVLKLFIECKYSAKDKPWVIVVTSDRFGQHAFFSRTFNGKHPSSWKTMDSLQGRLMARMIQQADRRSDLDGLLVTNPGYVVAEALREQGDHAYEAIMQISKCVEAHDHEAEKIFEKTVQGWEAIDFQTSRSLPGIFFSIAFPVVVINGQLFESYLTENNTIEAAEIESGTVFVPYRQRKSDPQTSNILSPVSVVTERHIDRYANSVKKAFEGLLAQSEAIQEVIRFEHSKIINPQQEDDF